jgi:hypothetical protein
MARLSPAIKARSIPGIQSESPTASQCTVDISHALPINLLRRSFFAGNDYLRYTHDHKQWLLLLKSYGINSERSV